MWNIQYYCNLASLYSTLYSLPVHCTKTEKNWICKLFLSFLKKILMLTKAAYIRYIRVWVQLCHQILDLTEISYNKTLTKIVLKG